MKKLFTSESVTEGHPDKLCDYIADSILDAYLEQDKDSRVACEVMAFENQIIIAGQITSKATNIDIEQTTKQAIKQIGYNDENSGMNYKTCKIKVNISKQSPDIAIGVNKSLEEKNGEKINSEGAGDQGIMFGFACDETENYMPMPIYFAHKLAQRLTEVRKNNVISYLRPDGKVQVTVEYENDTPIRIDTIVVSAQHKEDINLQMLRNDIKKYVIEEIIPSKLLNKDTKYYINATGRFAIGGPLGDTGLTGRKIIIDTYGGYAKHGGGSFSGKDATKVDRSASYMARFLAKNIVANKYARKCEIQLSYAIGVARPVSIYIDTFNTETISKNEIIDKIINKFDLTPKGIIDYLRLKEPIYKATTNYGHFGKETATWEKIVKL